MDPYGLSLIRRRKKRQMHLFITIVVVMDMVVVMYLMLYMMGIAIHRIEHLQDKKRNRRHQRLQNLNKLIREGNVGCKNELRMNIPTFWVLCEMLRDVGGLTGTRNMKLEEIGAMFLYTLAHHRKNRSVGSYFLRSGESVSRQFNRCLLAVLKLHPYLFKKPTPIKEDCEDERWKLFQVRNFKYFVTTILIKCYVSKVKWFKDKYNVLNEILGTSGFKWDDENKMLKCERKNFESYCTGNKNAQGLWRVPFPFLEQLDLVFGPDRATGDVCEDVTDAVNNMEKEGVNIEGDEDSDDDNESVAQSIQRNPPPTTSKKARKKNIPKDKERKR